MDKHRLTAVGSIVIAVAAASVGIAVAQKAFTGPPDVGPPTLGAYAPTAVTAKSVVATGSTSKGAYSLRAFTNDRGESCLELTQAGDVTGSCGHAPTAAHPIGTTLTDQLPGVGGDRLVVGVAAGNVGTVEAESAGTLAVAQTRGTIDGGDHVFVMTLKTVASQPTVLTAKDGTGRSLAQTAIHGSTG
jgi:hypothetical protein